jgi:hypothetical protein
MKEMRHHEFFSGLFVRKANMNRTEHIMAGTAVTLVRRPFPVFCATLALSIQQPCLLNTVQYLAHRNVGKVTWFQETMTQVPKS